MGCPLNVENVDFSRCVEIDWNDDDNSSFKDELVSCSEEDYRIALKVLKHEVGGNREFSKIIAGNNSDKLLSTIKNIVSKSTTSVASNETAVSLDYLQSDVEMETLNVNDEGTLILDDFHSMNFGYSEMDFLFNSNELPTVFCAGASSLASDSLMDMRDLPSTSTGIYHVPSTSDSNDKAPKNLD